MYKHLAYSKKKEYFNIIGGMNNRTRISLLYTLTFYIRGVTNRIANGANIDEINNIYNRDQVEDMFHHFSSTRDQVFIVPEEECKGIFQLDLSNYSLTVRYSYFHTTNFYRKAVWPRALIDFFNDHNITFQVDLTNIQELQEIRNNHSRSLCERCNYSMLLVCYNCTRCSTCRLRNFRSNHRLYQIGIGRVNPSVGATYTCETCYFTDLVDYTTLNRI